MPGFDDIIGQHRPIRILRIFLRNATLPHALLFTGIAGVGKRMTAEAVAMALNCRQPAPQTDPVNACGQCRPCRQIKARKHPDVILIEPERENLPIAEIRKLLGTLALKPFGTGQRVVIIADSQAMKGGAANALLKVLEEPPADTTLILTARQKSDLLETIVSRCRHVRFNGLNSDALATQLGPTLDGDASTVETLAALSGGSLTRAEKIMTSQWQERREWLLRSAGLDLPAMLERRSPSMALAFAEQMAVYKKKKLEELLDILKIWIRDLAIWPHEPELAVHRAHGRQLAQVRQSMEDNQVLALWAAVEKAQKDIAANANLRLTLDVMALSMIRAV